MLNALIVENRDHIIRDAIFRTGERLGGKATGDAAMNNGVPLFLAQLLVALSGESRLEEIVRGTFAMDREIAASAALHGRDLLTNGFSVEQVVHGYGDVCQIITELATRTRREISSDDFRTLNRCLDHAIAGAVGAYGRKREWLVANEGAQRLGILAHELRNLAQTAALSFEMVRQGSSTSDMTFVHARNLTGLRALADRSVAEVRMEALVQTKEIVSFMDLVEEIRITGAMQASAYQLELTVEEVATDAVIRVDRHLVMSAISNLVLNALKFTRGKGRKVAVTPVVTEQSVRIQVADECGGLPPGIEHARLFRPFVRGSPDHTGLGLGLSIALGAVRANGGDISVRDVPGTGCVFTVTLPRHPPPADGESAIAG